MEHSEILGLSPEEKKAWFKEATITHRLLEQIDRVIMRAIREHGGFAYVLVYGPSGVGKTTMIRQVHQRLNGTVPTARTSHFSLRNYSGTLTKPLYRRIQFSEGIKIYCDNLPIGWLAKRFDRF